MSSTTRITGRIDCQCHRFDGRITRKTVVASQSSVLARRLREFLQRAHQLILVPAQASRGFFNRITSGQTRNASAESASFSNPVP